MGGREKAEPESSGGLGIARVSVRARDRTFVPQGTGSETVTTRAAAYGLLVAAPRPSSRRVFTRRGHPRSTKLERWMLRPSLAPHTHDDAVMQQPHSAVRQAAICIHGVATRQSRSRCYWCARHRSCFWDSRRSARSLRAPLLHAAAAEQPPCPALIRAPQIAQVQLRH
ncbi:unnamed protein product [Pelagomonas calceolata]|uniref:Uncharacterized protein n=1 Tax=Pelagomonas calceolata TaxID=35677 RepID=A0A7S4EE83_9STRA|nr:unnamed protein product [Pelagomonas calceolata]